MVTGSEICYVGFQTFYRDRKVRNLVDLSIDLVNIFQMILSSIFRKYLYLLLHMNISLELGEREV